MNFEKFNKKLSRILNKKMQKQGTLGNYVNIKTDEDMVSMAKMSKEILDLPKYQPIIQRLRGSNGIVNIVTSEDYGPLTELMIKMAFPSSSNDIFKGQLSDVDEYYVSPNYFHVPQAIHGVPTAALVKAKTRLEELLLGTKVRMTRDWMKESLGMDDQELHDFLGPEQKEQVSQQQLDQRIQQGQAPVARNPLGQAIDTYKRSYDNIVGRYKRFIDDINQKLAQGKDDSGREYLPEQIKKLKDKRAILISKMRSEIEALNDSNLAEVVLYQDPVSGEYRRNTDGFINFSDEDVLWENQRKFNRALIKWIGSGTFDYNNRELKEAHKTFRENVEDLPAKTPSMKAIKEKLLGFLGIGSLEDINRIAKGIATDFASTLTAYKKEKSKYGKVMILDDFDRSILCKKRTGESKGKDLTDEARSVFVEFTNKNQAHLEEDDSTGKVEKGNRILIIITNEIIKDLPSSNIIELRGLTIDKEEAEIIIKSLLTIPTEERVRSYTRKLHQELQEKYNKPNADLKQEGFDREEIARKVEEFRATSGGISDETLETLVGLITNMGYREAINCVRMALKRSVIDEGGPINSNVVIDEEVLIDSLANNIKERIEAGTFGLKQQEVEVDLENYAMRRVSPWADRVRTLSKAIEALARYKEIIKQSEERLRKINHIISMSERLSPNDPKKLSIKLKENLMKEKNDLQKIIIEAKTNRDTTGAIDIPHFYILYGEPGVGKSVWAQALASLLGYKTYTDVDVAASKDKWVGETGKNAKILFNVMRSSRNTVFLIDEIDRQIEQGKAQGQNTHETTKEIQAEFLKFFDNTANEKLFKQNGVFFIMTSNYISNIDRALKSRCSEQHEVLLPNEPDDYKKFFWNNMVVEKKRFPDEPWFKCPVNATTKKEVLDKQWEYTWKRLQELDWDAISRAFAGKEVGQEIDFRQLKMFIKTCICSERAWQNSLDAIAEGHNQELDGLPMTTQNLVSIGNIMERATDDKQGSDQERLLGVGEVSSARYAIIRKVMEPYLRGEKQFETETYIHHITGEKKTRRKIPDEVIKIMNGETKTKDETEEPEKQFEYVRTRTPDGKIKTELVEKEKKDLMQKGLIEIPLVEKEPKKEEDVLEEPSITEQPQSIQAEEQKNTEDNKTISSSTDYLFDFLRKQGLIDSDGNFIKKNAKGKFEQKKEIISDDKSVETDNGVHVFNGGFIMFAPNSPDTKSQSPRYY